MISLPLWGLCASASLLPEDFTLDAPVAPGGIEDRPRRGQIASEKGADGLRLPLPVCRLDILDLKICCRTLRDLRLPLLGADRICRLLPMGAERLYSCRRQLYDPLPSGSAIAPFGGRSAMLIAAAKQQSDHRSSGSYRQSQSRREQEQQQIDHVYGLSCRPTGSSLAS
jgi:hypothetical protein